MKQVTDQSEEVCLFYLESSDWNVEVAIDMYESMKN